MSKSNCRSRSCKPIVELVPKGDSAFVSAWRGVAVGGKREKVIGRGTMRQGETREDGSRRARVHRRRMVQELRVVTS